MSFVSFFDTHTHLDYLHQFTQEPLETLMQNALSAGVDKILIVAVMRKDFETIQNLTALYPAHLRYSLGLHPLHIKQHTLADLDCLEQFLSQRHKNLTAVAEIGLERAVPELTAALLWKKQYQFFEAQLHLAKQYDFPVNLHSRKSHDQLFTFLKRIDVARKGVVHGFAGSYEQAKRFLDLGYKIGVGGTITYERANKTRQAIAKLPLDGLLLETDSPDMPVFGFQGQPNRPERIENVFQALCQLRAETPEKIKEVIWQNSLHLFG
ncbi:TatD DNase family protein [Pasteurella langaaensis DSM 22999]|uniref:TatD DNase family protein n=1 Tax=Alitibacter langaaensis DSM 22999 TaxID=1122935 RepID=A0A2U0SNW8_9PAST|nr:TatD family hydrolase [Pasteurella langaaensis]PVX33045.1 TatD DNase family protein [Pasteurella langaaensis DSM 22999]